ncbi:MAG: hypothetical protein KDI61_11915 [Alphaproteobacteria bacterium]|nr:hypothetical protein [Alphaproteobacteria bacterium]MCB1840947.1 hypothetical protein [Alphaproteobacteria bacterium]
MGFIRKVYLNPTRAKFSLTFKLLGIFSVIISVALVIFHPASQLVGKSIWLYPLIFIFRWLYVLSGPIMTTFYFIKALGLEGGLRLLMGPCVIGGIALILWINILLIRKLEPQTVMIPVILWLGAGGWATYMMLAIGK